MPTRSAESVLSYSPEQLFDLVADVEAYPDFLPGWVAARVRSQDGATYFTDQLVRFRALRHRFQSRTVLERPKRILVESTDQPFRRLAIHWVFDRLADGRCRVRLAMSFEFRSRTLGKLLGDAPGDLVCGLVEAFERRAGQLYGPSFPGLARG